jgi:hypothetical protein
MDISTKPTVGKDYSKKGRDEGLATECTSRIEVTEDMLVEYQHEGIGVAQALRPQQMLLTGNPELTLIPDDDSLLRLY